MDWALHNNNLRHERVKYTTKMFVGGPGFTSVQQWGIYPSPLVWSFKTLIG